MGFARTLLRYKLLKGDNDVRRMRRTGTMALLGSVLLASATLTWGCSDLVVGSPLENARKSPEALARAALESFMAGDEEALDALRVGREEYENLLWPVLPDRNHVPFEFVWSLTDPRSRKARREVSGEYEGIPLELVSVDLGDKAEVYDEFTLYQNARMKVRRTDTGEEGLFPLMDAIVVMGGGWKFLNFGENL